MHLIKEKLDIEESLESRIKTTLKFLNIKSKIEKVKIEGTKFYLKYNRENSLYQPFKLIPLFNAKNITHYGIIEVPVLPPAFIII